MRRFRSTTSSYVVRAPKVDVRQLALELKAALDPAGPQAPTLGEFAPRWIQEYAKANQQKPRGVQSKQSILDTHLLPRFGELRLDAFTDSHVQQLKAGLVDRSPKTVNNVLTVLNKLLKTAVKWRSIERMPVTIELLKVPPSEFRFFEFEEFEYLVERAGKVEARAAVMVLLGGEAGLRMGEIIALEWRDCDFRREQLTVARSESQGELTVPKGGRSRVVPMTKRLLSALNALHLTRRDEQRRVLVRDDGSHVSEQTLRTWMDRVEVAAGHEPSGALHVLRHTFCSHLAMRGAPPLAIKELAGHSSLRTTLRYMHLSSSEAKRAIALLDSREGQRVSAPPLKPAVSPTGFEPVGAKKAGAPEVSRRKVEKVSAAESRRAADDAPAWMGELDDAVRRGSR